MTRLNTEERKETLAYSVTEFAAASGFSEWTIREAIKNSHLVAKRHGKRLVILPEDGRTWLKSLEDA